MKGTARDVDGEIEDPRIIDIDAFIRDNIDIL